MSAASNPGALIWALPQALPVTVCQQPLAASTEGGEHLLCVHVHCRLGTAQWCQRPGQSLSHATMPWWPRPAGRTA